jgi:hypothetical protein
MYCSPMMVLMSPCCCMALDVYGANKDGSAILACSKCGELVLDESFKWKMKGAETGSPGEDK